MRNQQTPDGGKYWMFKLADQNFRFHDKNAGTVTTYSPDSFETWCMDLLETITGTRPNGIAVDVIDGLRVKFRTIEFGGC